MDTENNNEDEVIYKELNEFTLGGCLYHFPNKIGLNAMKLPDAPGYITVCRGFDEYFIGVGNQADSAMYDWKVKFHGFFQRFEVYGPSNEKEENLQEIMHNCVDLDLYKSNRYYVKVQEGVITGTRFYGKFPCSYQLDGLDKIQPLPDYDNIDPSFIILEQGDRFKVLFEYRLLDNDIHRILYGEKV